MIHSIQHCSIWYWKKIHLFSRQKSKRSLARIELKRRSIQPSQWTQNSHGRVAEDLFTLSKGAKHFLILFKHLDGRQQRLWCGEQHRPHLRREFEKWAAVRRSESNELINWITHHRSRYDSIQHSFKQLYHHRPDFYARSPGRVNLIGEHIDYSLYSVLPMGLEGRDIVIAVRVADKKDAPPSKTHIRIANTNNKEFGSKEFTLDAAIAGYVEVDKTNHHWTNYFLSGLKVSGRIFITLDFNCINTT